MQIFLADVTPEMTDAFEAHCGDLDNVKIHRGSILDVKADIIVSPANSFGFMNGGIDALYTRHFGPQVQRRLQEEIIENWYGELPVGSAEYVSTLTDEDAEKASAGEDLGKKWLAWMIAAPTMRVPTSLPENTINPYLAARAALIVAKYKLGDDYSIVFPGMGTGVGGVDPVTCAQQMRMAIQRIAFNEWKMYPTNLSQGYFVPVKGDVP